MRSSLRSSEKLVEKVKRGWVVVNIQHGVDEEKRHRDQGEKMQYLDVKLT